MDQTNLHRPARSLRAVAFCCAFAVSLAIVIPSSAEPGDAGPDARPTDAGQLTDAEADIVAQDVIDKESSVDEAYCGDGVVGRSESCDPGWRTDGGATEPCTTFGYQSGQLTCTPLCTWSIDDCVGAVCGDGRVDSPEQCDVPPGELTDRCPYGERECVVCTRDCTWVEGLPSWCGDGILDPRTEHCDGDVWGTDNDELLDGTCASEGLEGDRMGCSPDCRAEYDDCGPAICGDGLVVWTQEACDDGNQDVETCPRGEVSCEVCGPDCEWVPGLSNACGDGIVQGAFEACDGVGSPMTCVDDCGTTHQTTCTEACTVDTTPCDARCGAGAGADDSTADAATGGPEDAGGADTTTDAGMLVLTPTGGEQGCASSGRRSQNGPPVALALLAGLAFARRRR